MPKNIVIFADGTAREGDGTNVSKLHFMVESRSQEQLVLYVPGVGTEESKVTGTIGGMGISSYLLECYDFINANYLAGDEIFLFGFSRGAALILSLTSFIHLFGILPRRPGVLEKAYSIYQIKDARYRMQKADDFIGKKFNCWTKVKFVGLFDAVASLGLPLPLIDRVLDIFLPHRFHLRDTYFCESFIHLRQALAIDEKRLWFQPLLMASSIKPSQTIKQVWFCGSHSDVGGGYVQNELSDIPLEWMMLNAQECGLKIDPRHKVRLNPDPNGTMHDPCSGALSKFYPKKTRFWDCKAFGKPIIHKSVLERTLNNHNEPQPRYAPWILDGSFEYDLER